MTEQPMSRREARELERLRASGEISVVGVGTDVPVDSQNPEEIQPPVEVLSRRAARELETQREIEAIQVSATGPIKYFEPTALVVDSVRDITNMTVAVPDTNLLIQTGAIELPKLSQDTANDSQIVAAAAIADESVFTQTEHIVRGIEPVAARAHTRTKRKESVFPTKLRRGWGVVYIVGASAFLLGVLVCLLFASVLLGIIKL